MAGLAALCARACLRRAEPCAAAPDGDRPRGEEAVREDRPLSGCDLRALRRRFDLPFVGTVPPIKPAAANSEEEHRQNAENLLRILSEFGVEVTLGEIHVDECGEIGRAHV